MTDRLGPVDVLVIEFPRGELRPEGFATLLDLVERFGLSREDAYAIVQDNAMECWKGGRSFSELLWEDRRVNTRLSREELLSLFEPGYYFRWVDEIFGRFQNG